MERTRERSGEEGECGSSKAVFASSIRARVAHVRLSFAGAGQRLRGRISVFPAAKGELAPPRNVSQARKYTAVNTHSVYRGYVKMRRLPFLLTNLVRYSCMCGQAPLDKGNKL